MQTYSMIIGILLFLLVIFVFTAKYYREKYKDTQHRFTLLEESRNEVVQALRTKHTELTEARALLKKNLQSQNTVNAILPGVQIPKVSDYLKTLPPDTVVTLKMRFVFKGYNSGQEEFGMCRNGGPMFYYPKDDVDEYTL